MHLAFLAQDAKTHVFYHANADLNKETQNDEALQFVEFQQQRTGYHAPELISDSESVNDLQNPGQTRYPLFFLFLQRKRSRLKTSGIMVLIINDYNQSLIWTEVINEPGVVSTSRIHKVFPREYPVSTVAQPAFPRASLK